MIHRLRPLLGDRPKLAAGLFLAGGLAVALALAANRLGIAASRGFGVKKAALLIVGCDLIVAGLVASASQVPRRRDDEVDLVALLSSAIADGVLLFALSACSVIVLFGQSKPIERLGYFLTILVVVPLVVTLAWRRQRAGALSDRSVLLAFATLALTAATLCVARLLHLSRSATLDTSLFLVLGLIATRVAVAVAGRSLPAASVRIPARAMVALIPLLFAAAVAPFVPSATMSVVDIAVALVAGIVAFDLVRAFGSGRRIPRGWARVFDVGIFAACALVVVYFLPDPTNTLVASDHNLVLATNHNYFLGPTLDVLHGRAMLVGTFSQYGVGIFDALAAVFLVVPIGYGTSSLLVSVLTVFLFMGLYVILRWSTQSLLIPAIGLTVAVVLDIFGQIDDYVDFPSTGVLRFGLPWVALLLSLAATRTPRRKRLFDALVLVTVGGAAVWSAEAGAYTLGTAGALACFDALVAQASGRERGRMAARRCAQLLAASASGILAFTLLTWVTTGAWANWGAYLYYVRLYTTGGFGNLPIRPWSPGLALGAMYALSAIVLVLLAVVRPALIRERAVAYRAAVGLTALGTLVYTYYLGRAHPNNLIHVSPPAVGLLFVWLGIIRLTFDDRLAVAVATATAVFLGAMIVASEADDISQKYPTTALAAMLGSGPRTFEGALTTLWSNGYWEGGAVRVVALVSSLRPRPRSLELLLTPFVETEALLHLGTANAVESSNPCQESLSTRSPAQIANGVRALRPGGVLITSADPELGRLLPIERYTLALLRARFTLRQIGADRQGLQAFRLTTPAHALARLPPAPRVPVSPFGCA